MSDATWKAANYISSGQLLNQQLMSRYYSRIKIDMKDKDAVKEAESAFESVFGTKRQATTERDVKGVFPELPPGITNSLNNEICSVFNKDKKELSFGNRSLRTYKKGLPMPTTKSRLIFESGDDKFYITWKPSRNEHFRFSIFLGRDKGGYKQTLAKIVSGELDYGAGKIQIKDKDIFLLLPVKDAPKETRLNPELVVGVDIGMDIPVYVVLSDNSRHWSVGSKRELLRPRHVIQQRKKMVQKVAGSARGGHGRKRKIQAISTIRDKERNFAKQYNHYLSRQVIRFALKNKAGIIKMEDLSGMPKERRKFSVLKDWTYFELQSMIEYKAKLEGIKVIKVKAAYTSQTCSKCGCVDKESRRTQAEFCCTKCGHTMNADHNAALNIANAL